MTQRNDDECSSCDELENFFFEYTDGELESSILERMRIHVTECSRCADLVDAEMHIRELIRRCCAEEAPSGLRARVVTRIRSTHIRIERY
ncbi:MAG: mycothiol system anti-sigma-R factor [Actinomycetaceae bacterium]|nr:mycothiol system anti-sigma-R factor [Actinomycetaceae bacterium]